MSRNFIKGLMLEDTSIEINVDVTEAVEATEEVSEAADEIKDTISESDDTAAIADVVEDVKEAVLQYGYTAPMAKIVESLGIVKAIESHHIVVVGSESLNSTGRNEEQARLIVSGCEAIGKTSMVKIREFLANLLKQIEAFMAKVIYSLGIRQKTTASRLKTFNEIPREKMPVELGETDGSTAAEYLQDSAKATSLLESINEMLKTETITEVPEPFISSSLSGTWNRDEMSAHAAVMKALYATADKAKQDIAGFKKLASIASAAAKKAEDGDTESAEYAKELRNVVSEAGKRLREGLVLIGKASSTYNSALKKFIKAANVKLKDEPK